MQSSDRVSSVMVASSRLFAYFNHSLVAVSCVKVILVIAFRGAVTDADDGWHSGQLAYYQVNCNCAFDIIDSGDYNEKVIEQYPCECDVDVCTSIECKRRLLRKEGEYIRQYRDEYGKLCVNKAIAGRTKREWGKDNPDKVKQYETSPARQSSKKEYKDSGRRAEVNKLWRDNHTEYIAQQNKEWREKNNERLKEKVACDKCGQLIVYEGLKKHQKRAKCKRKQACVVVCGRVAGCVCVRVQ